MQNLCQTLYCLRQDRLSTELHMSSAKLECNRLLSIAAGPLLKGCAWPRTEGFGTGSDPMDKGPCTHAVLQGCFVQLQMLKLEALTLI